MAFPVVRVLCYCRGPGAKQFPVFPGQRLLLLFYACAVTCGRSLSVLSVWGVLISFWSVLVFSSAFFRCFFRGTICLSSFVFPGAFFSVLVRRIGGILLSPCIVARFACVGPFVFNISPYARQASYVPGGGGYLGQFLLCNIVPLTSPNPYPIIVYSVANFRPHLSHF